MLGGRASDTLNKTSHMFSSRKGKGACRMKKIILFVLIISCWSALFADDNCPDVNSFYDLINFYNMKMQKLDTEADKAKAETSKLKAEAGKMRTETTKKQAETTKMRTETTKMRAEAAKKQAETTKMRAEAAKKQAEKEILKLNVLSEEVINILIKNYGELLSELEKANIKWIDCSAQTDIKDVVSFIKTEKPPKAIEEIITKFGLSWDKGAAQIISMQFCFLALKWERLLKEKDYIGSKEFMQVEITTIKNLISRHDFDIVEKHYAELDSILGK